MTADNTGAPAPALSSLLGERLREVQAAMVDAVLSGDRMREVAAIAARRLGAPVGVIVPELGHELIEPEPQEAGRLETLRAYVDRRLDDADAADAEAPEAVVRAVPVTTGGSVLGAVLQLGEVDDDRADEAEAVLHLAATAAMTDLALVQGRQQAEEDLRGSFLEELRAGVELDGAEVVRRASRLGCDLTRGALILAAEPEPDRVHRFMAAIKADRANAFVQRLDGRIYAVFGVDDGEDGPDRAVALAGALARRLGATTPVGLSTFQRNPAELGRAIQEADLVVDVVGRSDLPPDRLTDGTYRLLVQLLSSHPEQLDAYHERSVAPLARYDEQYRTDLVGTLAAYLDHDGELGATAAALFAHRHTVAYRLDRIRELSGLDPNRYEDREQLSLGLKIHRLSARPR